MSIDSPWDYRDTPVFADLDDGETPRPARRSPSRPAPLSSQQKLSDNQNLRYSLSMPCYEPKMPPMRVLAFLPTANPAQPRGDGRDSGPVEPPRAPRWLKMGLDASQALDVARRFSAPSSAGLDKT
jgi:hypothetical protein